MTADDRGGVRRRLLTLVREFKRVNIAVVGDVMLDQFIWGNVERISPEAPVPVVKVKSESVMLGGAANVANNLRSLGARVRLLGVIGDDPNARTVRNELERCGIDASALVQERGRATTVKTRIIAHSQQVVRYDREELRPIERSSALAIRRALELMMDGPEPLDAVIVSDYGKGVISRSLISGLRKIVAGRAIVAVDPKVRKLGLYRGLNVITPNHHEAGQALGRKLRDTADVEWAGERLLKEIDLEAVLITRGEEGISLFLRGEPPAHIPTMAREVFDVTGAGDTVISVLTLARGAGSSWAEAAVLANYAAGIVVGEIGTATVSPASLIAELRRSRISLP